MKTMLLIAAAALAATGATAQTAPAGKTAPAAKPAAAARPAPAAKTGSAKMATATTKTGKKITYDCSKKGNATKKACKG